MLDLVWFQHPLLVSSVYCDQVTQSALSHLHVHVTVLSVNMWAGQPTLLGAILEAKDEIKGLTPGHFLWDYYQRLCQTPLLHISQ